MKPRPHQSKGLAAVRSEYEKGVTRQLIAMATGTGKTVLFANLPEYMSDILPGQTLVLAHREELIGQAVNKIRLANPDLKVDAEIAEDRADEVNADVIVASVATLGRKGTKRIGRFNWDNITKVITDEAHHSVATSYKNIYEASGVLLPESRKLLLGVTATACRGDGKALAEIYQKIVYTYGLRQAIAEGWLVDIRGIRVNTGTDISDVTSLAGDFALGALADRVNDPIRNELIVEAWLKAGENRTTLGFGASVQHAKDLAELFNKNGVEAAAVWGDDPERKDKLAALRVGQIQVLMNFGVLTEGYDDWHISCVLLGRPTQSPVLFTQMVGRATRLQDGTGNLLTAESTVKHDCLAIDVVDATRRHSLVTLPTLMGLSNSLDLGGRSLMQSVRDIEAAQERHPNTDFNALKDVTQLKSFIEAIDIFEIKLPAEVENNSHFTWQNAVGGGYIMLFPNKEKLVIRKNILDKFELSGILKKQKYRAIRDNIEDIFAVADNLITSEAPEQLRLIDQNKAWRSAPPTDKQLARIATMYKGKPLPNSLTKGMAAQLISQFIAKRTRA